jgi:hypothetical protein
MAPRTVHGGGVQADAQSIKGAKHESEFRARMASSTSMTHWRLTPTRSAKGAWKS